MRSMSRAFRVAGVTGSTNCRAQAAAVLAGMTGRAANRPGDIAAANAL